MVGADAHCLILGSMPGVPSLEAARYYANPRNAFWWIAQELWGVPEQAPYEARLEDLREAGIALWDVLAHCERQGSLDSQIVRASEQAQPLAAFLASHPSIKRVAWNGGKAKEAWKRHVAPTWPAQQELPQLHSLPSTSPAYAAMSREQKLAIWREQLLA